MTNHQAVLLDLLRRHQPADELERGHLALISSFVASREDCFSRSALPGHLTGSAFVIHPASERLLLHHHRKLGRWLQMGGHDEGERDAAATALREAREESGLGSLELIRDLGILDVDIHRIPARGQEPGHDHLDVRFLVSASSTEGAVLDARESVELGWFTLAEAGAKMNEVGAARVLTKVDRWLRGTRGVSGGQRRQD